MPKAVEGKFHKMAVTNTAKANKANLLNLNTSLNVFLLCSDIFIYVFMVSNNAAKLSIFSIRQKKYQKSLRISWKISIRTRKETQKGMLTGLAYKCLTMHNGCSTHVFKGKKDGQYLKKIIKITLFAR